MNGFARCLVVAIAFGVVSTGVQAKGAGGGAGKVSGWSSAPAGSRQTVMPLAGSTTTAAGGSKIGGKNNAAQGFNGLDSANIASMSGMLITPNGMIARNSPPPTVTSVGSLAGSSQVAVAARGFGNSQVGARAQGVGNSQGSGGTADIAQMTHFGVSGLSMVGSIIGASGIDVSSVVSHFLNSSSAPTPSLNPGASGAGSATQALKAQLLGAPTNNACVGGSGAKSGCSGGM
ncbi:MAG TPA: hypothetical protein VGH80_01830 [Xanthomonadaceae bacterium]